MFVTRNPHNPILAPEASHSWEDEAVFNGTPLHHNGTEYLVYRALSKTHYHAEARQRFAVSTIGIAQKMHDGTYENRTPFIKTDAEFDRYGCEDPRTTTIDGMHYTFYTALSAFPPGPDSIKVALAIHTDLDAPPEKHLITPFNAKAMTLFPEKVEGKYVAALTIHTDTPGKEVALCIATFERLEDMWSPEYWEAWYHDYEKNALPLKRLPQDHVELGAPPLKTSLGWLLLYSYIYNYHTHQPRFGVEAVVLDIHNPQQILHRSNAPLLVPELYYERFGITPNIVFPSGAQYINEHTIELHYGGADTTCATAYIDVDILVQKLSGTTAPPHFTRAESNPILLPRLTHDWETLGVFNPAAIRIHDTTYILYRAQSENTKVSTFGIATSKDGITIDMRSDTPVYTPRADFERPVREGIYSGCEDPRITQLGDTLYVLYTAYDGEHAPRVALTSITTHDFVAQNWKWSQPVAISPPDLNDKDACLFPEKIQGKYFFIHRVGDDMDYAYRNSLDFGEDDWLQEERWVLPRSGYWDSKKVGVAAPPLRTDKGWLLFYHGVSELDGHYRVGALLLDLNDPTKILARSDEPLFEPETAYERYGAVPNVVFPCGAVLDAGTIYLYYGGADSVVAVATIPLEDILHYLNNCGC